MDDDTHQISRRRCDSLSATRLSTSAISHARPVWSGIEPRLRAASAGADAGGVPTIMSMSMNGARRPAFGHFAAVGVEVVISASLMRERMSMNMEVLYRPHMADACCFVPGNVGVDVVMA